MSSPNDNPTVQVTQPVLAPYQNELTYQRSMKVEGNRDTTKADKFGQLVRIADSDPVLAMCDIGIWILTPAFLVSITSPLPYILQAAFLVPVLAMFLALGVSYLTQKNIRLHIAVRIVLIIIGFSLGAAL